MALSNDKKNRLQGVAGAGILGLLGYSAMKSNLVEDAIGNANKINGLTMGRRKAESELRDVGENLKVDVNALKEATDRLRRESIESLRERFINRLDSFLEEGEGKTLGEKRAFFAAFFDSIKEEELVGGGEDSQLRELIEKGYNSLAEDLDFPPNSKPTLDATDRQTLLRAFSNTFSTDESLERFGKAFQKYQSSIEHFATRSRVKNFGVLAGQLEGESFSGTLEDFFKKNIGYNTEQQSVIQKRFQRLNQRLGNNNAAVSFKSFAEGGGVRSLYARVEFSGNKILNIPLHLGTDESGNVIYRATENLSSRYVAPLHVIRADAVMDITSMSSTRFRSLSEARKGGGVVDFVSYIFDDMMGNLRTQDIMNMSQRRINEITAYQRNFGLDAPRTMMNSALNRGMISDNLYNNLHASRNFQSSNALVTGLEFFQRGDQKNVVKRLLKFYGDELIGVSAAQTMTARYDDPYSPTGLTRMFGQIGMRVGDASLTAFDAVKTLGIKDRVLLPQTAREGQLFGRYEAIERLQGISTFGRTAMNVVDTASSGNLIGVSQKAKSTIGMNVAGFFIKERATAKLGLAEGVSYFGGKIVTSTSMPKTVVESGIANTKLMEMLLARQESGLPGIKVGKEAGRGIDFTIDEFFKAFGNDRGEAIIGHLDSDFASIKRRGGMEGFTLGLSQFSIESGRKRYHLIGQMDNLNLNSKLFSFLVKDTTAFADQETIGRKLASITDPVERQALEDIYYRRMGGDIGNTLLSSSAQFKKSVYNATVGMVGALSMIDSRFRQEIFDSEMRMSDDEYLSRINKIFNRSYGSLSEVSYGDRTGAYLHKAVETVLRAGSQLDDAGKLIVDKKTMGHILGSVEEFHSAYGLKDESHLLRLFEDYGYDTSKDSDFMKAYRSNVILAAGYSTTGGVHAELGRNIARVEPRFMNYLYTNLRTNFGFSGSEATGYLSSILLRQAGIESKATATLGMHVSMMSLSSLPGEDFMDELKVLGNITKMSSEDLNDLKSFGQGKERALSNFLSQREKGQILDFADLIQDSDRLEKIKSRLGGRTQIFLPGAETLENFEGFKIRGSGQTVQIEGEYTRYLTDLISSINALSVEKTDELFDRSLLSFEASKRSLSKVVGTAVRQSLSGNVLGSGSYMGSGFRFGLSADKGFEFDVDVVRRNEMRSGLLDAFNRQKGYVLFQDAQSFLDGMTTYKEALKKELRVRGFEGRKLSEQEIHQLTRSLTGGRLQEFFFSMKDSTVEAPTATGQRNPTLSFQHNLPGVNIMRYDFANGNQDAMFKYFSEYRGTFLNEEGVKLYRERKNSLIRIQEAQRRGMQTFDDQRYLDFIEQRKTLRTEIDALKTKLYGTPVEIDGKRQYKEVEVLNRKTGQFESVRQLVRNEGTVDAEIAAGRARISAVHENRVLLKEAEKAAKEGSTLRDIQARTSKQRQADIAFNQRIQTPLVEGGYVEASERTSRTNLRALDNKVDAMIARARKGYQSAQELNAIINEMEEQIVREKDMLRQFQVAAPRSEDEAKDLNRRIEAAKERVRTLKNKKRTAGNVLKAKILFEKAGSKFEESIYTDSFEGRIAFEPIVIQRQRGKDIKVRPSSYLGSIDYVAPQIGIGEGSFTQNELEFKAPGEDISVSRAYRELLPVGAQDEDMFDLRSARELNIIEKANQQYQMEDALERTRSSVSYTEDLIEREERFIAKHLNDPKKVEDVEDSREALRKLKESIPALKKREEELQRKVSGIRKSVAVLVESEQSGKLSINRTVASEAVLGKFEREALDSAGNFRASFMEETKAFYGMYDPGSGLTPRQFLSQNRAKAKAAFMNLIEQDVGEGKKYRNITSAMRGLLGIKEDTYGTIKIQKYDKEKGEYVTVNKRYLATEDEIERLATEQEELRGIREERSALFEDSAMEDARKDNLYYETQEELKQKREALSQLEKENAENIEIRRFEETQRRMSAQERMRISDLEDQAIRESLSDYRIDFSDLEDPDKIRKAIDEKRVVNRLSNLESFLGSGEIRSFEALREATRGRELETFEYERFDPGSGNVEKRLTSVGEELDKMMLGLLTYHTKYGEHGSGILHFPEINITAKLSNAASGATQMYEGRMDLSRFMIGDFDADIYQIFHDTNDIVRRKFNQNAASFHGFYQAGGEYLLSMDILGQGMKEFSARIGTSGMNAEQYLLDQYSKEKILKDVGPIDVQVKGAMFSMIHNASEAAARSGGDMGEYMRHVRASAALVSVAQEVLVIKSKKLPVASEIADNFLKGLQSAFKTGDGQQLINFFENNVFRGGVFEGSGQVSVSDIRFQDLPEGEASKALRAALESIVMNKVEFEKAIHEMAKTGNKLNILSMMSDNRAAAVMRDANVTTTRQLRQLMAASMEGGLIGTDGKLDVDVLERGLKDIQGSMSSAFTMNGRAKGLTGLALGALGASYLVGSTVSTNTLDIEEKFSDMRTRTIERSKPMMMNRDHQVGEGGITNMSQGENFYRRPINVGESYVTNSYAARMYGEAPTYGQAQSAARQFTSVGGQAFIAVQDTRQPISNSYINKSLRD